MSTNRIATAPPRNQSQTAVRLPGLLRPGSSSLITEHYPVHSLAGSARLDCPTGSFRRFLSEGVVLLLA